MRSLLWFVFILPLNLFSQDFCGYYAPENGDVISSTQQKNTDTWECLSFKCAVHIFHESDGYGDISDEQAESAILSLNESLANTGHKNDSEGIDYEVSFVLTGIERYNGSELWGWLFDTYGVASNGETGVPEGDFHDEMGLRGYDRDSIVNFIVYTKRDGSTNTLGFAYVGTPRNGVWVRFNRFGDSFYGSGFNLVDFSNRTTVHEVGHAFGLYHSFFNTPSCSSETNCAIQGDRVCDTPPQPVSYGCSFVCGENDENHMGYRSCRNRFTQGQKERTLLVFANPANKWENYLICDDPCNPIMNGDYNGDGFVNILDLTALIAVFNSTEFDGVYDPTFDTNCDGFIDALDLSLFITHWGSSARLLEDNRRIVGTYDILGRVVDNDVRGFVIVVYSDGTKEGKYIR